MASAGADGLGVTTMGSNVVQSVIDSMQGMYPGQPAPAANVAQPAPPPAYAGPAPGSFGYARDRAFDQAGQDFSRGNYLASAGSALRGVGNAIPAEVEGAYQGLTNLVAKPFGDAPVAAPQLNKDGSYPGLAGLAVGAAQNFMPMAHAGQEFARGVTGATPQSPMLPEFNQQVQQLQPPRPAAFPSNASVLSSGPTNGDVVAASLHAASRPANPLMPTYSAGAPTTGNWYDHVNQLLTGSGPAAGHEILAAAKAGTPFDQIAAGIPQLRQAEADSRRGAPGQSQNPYNGEWYTPGEVKGIGPQGATMWSPAQRQQLAQIGNPQNGGAQLPRQTPSGDQTQGRGGPVQGAIAAQQPMSDREAALQSLPPQLSGLIRTGHFSRDQVAHMVGSFAPQMMHERDPVWVGKNASANALASMANLTAHGVTEDKNGNVVVDPRTLGLPADRLKALGADPANGDVAAQLAYQYNVHKRTNSIWSQFFNSIIPLMQQGQGQ